MLLAANEITLPINWNAALSSKRFLDISHLNEIHCGQELGNGQLFSELITFVNISLNLVKVHYTLIWVWLPTDQVVNKPQRSALNSLQMSQCERVTLVRSSDHCCIILHDSHHNRPAKDK